jgi:hypothetical protein
VRAEPKQMDVQMFQGFLVFEVAHRYPEIFDDLIRKF